MSDKQLRSRKGKRELCVFWMRWHRERQNVSCQPFRTECVAILWVFAWHSAWLEVEKHCRLLIRHFLSSIVEDGTEHKSRAIYTAKQAPEQHPCQCFDVKKIFSHVIRGMRDNVWWNSLPVRSAAMSERATINWLSRYFVIHSSCHP